MGLAVNDNERASQEVAAVSASSANSPPQNESETPTSSRAGNAATPCLMKIQNVEASPVIATVEDVKPPSRNTEETKLLVSSGSSPASSLRGKPHVNTGSNSDDSHAMSHLNGHGDKRMADKNGSELKEEEQKQFPPSPLPDVLSSSVLLMDDNAKLSDQPNGHGVQEGNGSRSGLNTPSPKKKKKKNKKKKKKANQDGNQTNSKSSRSSGDSPSTKSIAVEEGESKSDDNDKAPDQSEQASVTIQPRTKGAETPPRTPEHDTPPDPQKRAGPSSSCKPSLSKYNVAEKLAHGKEPSRSTSSSPDHSVASSKSDKECGISSTPDTPASLGAKGDPKSGQANVDDADDGTWETVEVKPRRKKSQQNSHNNYNRNHHGRRSGFNHHHHHNNGRGCHHGGRNNDGNHHHHDNSHSHYNNGKRRERNRRRERRQHQQNQSNKMVEDVISNILDKVDEEVAQRGSGHSDRSGPTGIADKQEPIADNLKWQFQPAALPPKITPSSSTKSLRDILVGNTSPLPPTNTAVFANDNASVPNSDVDKGASTAPASKTPAAKVGSSKIKPGLSYKSMVDPTPPTQPAPPKPKPNAWGNPDSKIKKIPGFKQKELDVPRKIDTSEGVGTEVKVLEEEKISVLEANDDDVGEICRSTESLTDDDGVSPPLSTLLGPGNSCSASSSVASSLEAPHSSRFRHQVSSSTAVDDVGYHLLNVCGQLSDEINTFMSRRALALDMRRKERNAVLCALQDTLGNIWPGQCRVEMYGSCATQLDLPSSDLDLVVCGLDDPINQLTAPPPPPSVDNMHRLSCGSFHEGEVVEVSMLPPQVQVNHSESSPERLERSMTGPVLDPSTPDHTYNRSISDPGSAEYSTGHDNVELSGSFSPAVEALSPATEYQTTSLNVSGEISYAPPPEGAYPLESYHGSPHDVFQRNMTSPEGYQGTPDGYQGTLPPETYHSDQEDYQSNAPETPFQGSYGPEYSNASQQEFYYDSYSFGPQLSLNAQRVLRLASELESQPWAVQVKAIPTATVPVVKMLADPSRLPGLSGSNDAWLMHVAQAGSTPPLSAEEVPSAIQQWRGADIMNGLQPVDITFEGPEHGGIGSTTYSAKLVRDACEETGLEPESTPVVQVASVLKELLAQRRLNEPFSGGLSSYGLLLLLLAVLKDRTIIQEETKKMEQQRQEVTSVDNDASLLRGEEPPGEKDAPSKTATAPPASPGVDSSENSKSTAPSAYSKPTVSSSWASIAKNSKATARTDSLSSVTKSTAGDTVKTGTHQGESLQQKDRVGKKKKSKSQVKSESGTKGAYPEKKTLSAQDSGAVPSVVTPSTETASKLAPVPQGSNDVLEHFDSQATLIDVKGTHHPKYGNLDKTKLTPFIARPPGGKIDPVTGMFSVDPIVVYDPLEGAENDNVSKRCYCWNNVRLLFAQCYMTVSSAVEASGDSTEKTKHNKRTKSDDESMSKGDFGKGDKEILELFLSF